MLKRVIGRVFYRLLKGICGLVDLVPPNLNLTFQHQGFRILRIFFQDFLLELIRFVDSVTQDEKLNVRFCRNRNVFGMFGLQG